MPYRDPSPPRETLEDRLASFRARRKADFRYSAWCAIANLLATFTTFAFALMMLLQAPACPFCSREKWDPIDLALPMPWVILSFPVALFAAWRRPSWRKPPRLALALISSVLFFCLVLALFGDRIFSA